MCWHQPARSTRRRCSPTRSTASTVTTSTAGGWGWALAGGVSNISFSTLSADLGLTMYKYSFRRPPYYTLLVRSLSVLEGIALASDPNYKVGAHVTRDVSYARPSWYLLCTTV